MHGNAVPTAHTDAPPSRARGAPPAAAVGCYGPKLARTGAGREDGGPGGGGGGRGAVALSSAEKATIRAQRAAQHSAMQQQQLNTPGNPNRLDASKNCARAGRDQFHSHLTAPGKCACFASSPGTAGSLAPTTGDRKCTTCRGEPPRVLRAGTNAKHTIPVVYLGLSAKT